MKIQYDKTRMRGWCYSLTAVIFCLILTVGCGGGNNSGGSSNSNDGGDADWTYMVYMGADNNLSTSGLIDLNEMETAGSNNNVKIVLQAEFSTNYTDFGNLGLPYNDQTLRFLVENDNNTNNVDLGAGQSIGNVDMGDPTTLTDFIIWATDTYPAKHYALVIWDHGAGWKKSALLRGAVQDSTSDTFMSLPDLAQAVHDAGVHLDLINFDACLMAMYEVAYEFMGLADYMVFSEEVEPGNGDPYDTILSDLKDSPAMTGQELADTIVERYYDYYNDPETREEKVTKSAVDMSKVSNLHTAMLNLAAAIVDGYNANSAVITNAQTNTQHYEYPSNLDLYDFTSRLATNLPNGDIHTAALAANTAVASMVISNRYIGDAVEDSHGLAIFVPSKGQVSSDTLYDELESYNKLACNQTRATVWAQAVETIVGGSEEELHEGGFAFWVAWDTDADVDLYVWEPDEIYAPWMGQTTPNGYFSGDSYDTGESVEYYVANDYVQPGDYDIFIEYYSDGLTSNGANVSFWYYDPNTANDWQELGTVWLDLSDPYPGDTIPYPLNGLNAYSNYWYTGALTRAISEDGTVVINADRREVTIHLKHKKRALKINEELKQ
ncbi:MAG: hypothetical protein JW932_07100 [Deltaproteobacteria bacterium]|nr:hypothetical protein [Deltaproteobacteria bacterium]